MVSPPSNPNSFPLKYSITPSISILSPEGAAASSGIFHGVHIPGPDYAQLVAPFGGHGERVEDSSQLVAALRNALAAVNEGRIALVDVVLDI